VRWIVRKATLNGPKRFGYFCASKVTIELVSLSSFVGLVLLRFKSNNESIVVYLRNAIIVSSTNDLFFSSRRIAEKDFTPTGDFKISLPQGKKN